MPALYPMVVATKDTITHVKAFTEWVERQAARAGVDIYRTGAYFRIEPGSAFMPLYVENIGFGRVAVGHTFVQNGDVMFDPEVLFAVGKGGKRPWVPYSYRQDPLVPEQAYAVLNLRGAVLKVEPRRQAGVARFCNLWLSNLRATWGDAPITKTIAGE